MYVCAFHVEMHKSIHVLNKHFRRIQHAGNNTNRFNYKYDIFIKPWLASICNPGFNSTEYCITTLLS